MIQTINACSVIALLVVWEKETSGEVEGELGEVGGGGLISTRNE